MNKSDIRQKLRTYSLQSYAQKEEFPFGYCNVASLELSRELELDGLDVERVFSYINPYAGHTLLRDKNSGLLIDPTYGQIDRRYKYGFVGYMLPNKVLMQNLMDGETYMKLQQKRYGELYKD